MLKSNTAVVKAVNKAWPKELWYDALFKEYGSRYGVFPFYVPLRWCQSLLQILLAGFAEGVRRKNRKSEDSGTLYIKGKAYEGYHNYGKHQGSYNQVRAREKQFQYTTLFERRQLDQIREDVTWMDKLVDRVERLTGYEAFNAEIHGSGKYP